MCSCDATRIVPSLFLSATDNNVGLRATTDSIVSLIALKSFRLAADDNWIASDSETLVLVSKSDLRSSGNKPNEYAAKATLKVSEASPRLMRSVGVNSLFTSLPMVVVAHKLRNTEALA